jgi:hypothetical protein
VRIRWDWRSVAIAYGRVWPLVVAVVIPIVEGIRHTLDLLTWMLSAAFVLTFILARRAGRLSETEKARLRLLGSVTGFKLDPSRLQPSMREVKRDSLGELMEKGGIPTTADGIVSVLDDIPFPALPLVYGYACYAGDDRAWRECAALVHRRHGLGEF